VEPREYRKTKSPHQAAKVVIRVHLLLLLFVLEKSISGENKPWFGEASAFTYSVSFFVLFGLRYLGKKEI